MASCSLFAAGLAAPVRTANSCSISSSALYASISNQSSDASSPSAISASPTVLTSFFFSSLMMTSCGCNEPAITSAKIASTTAAGNVGNAAPTIAFALLTGTAPALLCITMSISELICAPFKAVAATSVVEPVAFASVTTEVCSATSGVFGTISKDTPGI